MADLTAPERTSLGGCNSGICQVNCPFFYPKLEDEQHVGWLTKCGICGCAAALHRVNNGAVRILRMSFPSVDLIS